jgi:lysozyme
VIASPKELIVLHEGLVPHAYQDSLGFWTIGVGHLIDQRKGGKLPQFIIDLLFEHDYKAHTAPLYKHQPWAQLLDPVRRAVLEDMAFNLGMAPFDNDGFKDWSNFLKAVRLKEYGVAAGIMRSSLWAKQVKQRAERLAVMMESGKWPDK